MLPDSEQVLCRSSLSCGLSQWQMRAACYAQPGQPTLVCLSIIDTGDSLAALFAKPSVPFSKSSNMEPSGIPLRNRLQPPAAWLKSEALMGSPSSRQYVLCDLLCYWVTTCHNWAVGTCLHRGYTPRQYMQPSIGCSLLVDLEGLQLLGLLRER